MSRNNTAPRYKSLQIDGEALFESLREREDELIKHH